MFIYHQNTSVRRFTDIFLCNRKALPAPIEDQPLAKISALTPKCEIANAAEILISMWYDNSETTEFNGDNQHVPVQTVQPVKTPRYRRPRTVKQITDVPVEVISSVSEVKEEEPSQPPSQPFLLPPMQTVTLPPMPTSAPVQSLADQPSQSLALTQNQASVQSSADQTSKPSTLTTQMASNRQTRNLFFHMIHRDITSNNLYNPSDDNNTRQNKILAYSVRKCYGPGDLHNVPLLLMENSLQGKVPKDFNVVRTGHIFMVNYPLKKLDKSIYVQFVSIYVVRLIQRFWRQMVQKEKTTHQILSDYVANMPAYKEAVVKNMK